MPSEEPIAIIGSAYQFPGGSDSPSKLWELLQTPRDLVQSIPKERRFDAEAFFHSDPEHHGTTNVQTSYFLEKDPAEFDNAFFNIQPAEAEAIDPQQRMLMETIYDSLCAAGHSIEGLRGSSTGIFVGVMGDDWGGAFYKDWDTLPQYSATGLARSILSNRVSYFFDWHGPSLTLDTACSSSLIAVHLAVQALHSGESHVAVAAGANLLLSPATYIAESNLHMLSPKGRSRMWDKDADGYARGEGIAAVVLKPLSKAIADGDHIECVIRATGVNQDGKTSGLTMPSSAAQASLISDTYARAGLDINKPEDRPQFFQAHGTGTPAGDPQEAEAISKAFYSRKASDKLYVGSIKTVIGHTEGTAGLASLIGASLAIQHGVIPPNLHFQELNPRIAPFYRHLEVPTSAKPWPKLLPGQPRRASVNSFGFGGTNAHAIIEAYVPEVPTRPSTGALFSPLIFSAATEKSLRSLLASYWAYLKDNLQVSLRDLAHTLQERRSTLAYRVFVTALTIDEATAKIGSLLSNDDVPELRIRHFSIPSPRILGIFTGQGAQWPRMGARLVEASPFVAKRLLELDAALASLPESDRPNWKLRDEILAEASASNLGDANVSQPVCTAVQILLIDLLEVAGIEFHSVIGHSSGEIAAAYAAGLLSATGAICVAYYRGLYAKMARSPNGMKGAMMAVGTSFEDASEFCELDAYKSRIQVAARNSSSSMTLSGDEDAISEAVEIFKDEGKFARQLKVDTAYHSAHMLPCSTPYLASMQTIGATDKTRGARAPTWYSSVHDGKVMTSDDLNPEYWVSNMTNPVLFGPAVAAAVMRNEPFDIALELGPHPALKGPCLDTVEEILGERTPYTGILSRGQDDILSISNALGFVWSRLGPGSVAFDAFETCVSGDVSSRNQVLDLPKYPFDHSNLFWSMSRVSGAHSIALGPPHPLLGRRCVDRETTRDVQWRNILRPKEIGWLKGHKIQRQIVFPAAGFIAMAVEAMKILAAGKPEISLIKIENLVIGRAMAFDDEQSGVESLFSVTLIHSDNENISAKFSCFSGPPREPGAMLVLNAEGSVTVSLADIEPDTLPFVEPEDFNMTEVGIDRFYDQLSELLYEYSPPFRGMLSLKRKNGYATGTLENQSGSEWEDQLLIHPGMLDTAIQSALAAFSCPGDGRMWGMYIPVGIRSIAINPIFTSNEMQKQRNHSLEAFVRDFSRASCQVDINVFSEDNAHTFVMVEGMELMPFTAARPDDDTVLFSSFEYKIDRPNGEAAASDDTLTPEDIQNAINAERVSFYYLRQLVETVTPDEKANTLPHYRHLLNWATKAVNAVKSGRNSFVPARCQLDTEEQIDALLERDRHRADVRLIESVGRNLPEVVRAGTGILEHMAEDGLFDFYDGGLGLDIANRHFARMVAQVTHRYPRMKILEIGAGTGGSTRNILPLIESSFSTYTYTDISSGFFEAAQERFGDYGGRMIFKTFDMEQPPAPQGFKEGSYDLVLASNVLHATGKLEDMMMNVRKLLKPGGYLIALELTSDDTLRVGLPMGSLPGWWVGAENGRPDGPGMSLPQWDSLLRKCGFGGVETSTPPLHKLYVSSIFAAQAVDDRIDLLRSPLRTLTSLPAAEAQRLVILGGETISTHRIAEQISLSLAPRFREIVRISSFEDIDRDKIAPSSTVISLTELDEPLFKTFSPTKFDALKILWGQAGTILWTTRGARAKEPYSFMTIGIGRVMRFEYPNISLELLDFDKIDDRTPDIIAEDLIRLEALRQWEKGPRNNELLWSMEPEVFVESGVRMLPRLYECQQANARYNASRRAITEIVSPKECNILFAGNSSSYELHRPSPLLLTSNLPTPGKTKSVKVSHVLLQTVRLTSVGSLMLCTGVDQITGQSLLALSPTAETRPTVVADWTVPLEGLDPPKALIGVAAYIIASSILLLVPKGCTLLVHEPDLALFLALVKLSRRSFVNLVVTTAIQDRAVNGCVYIPKNVSRRLISKALPVSPSVFVDLSQAYGSAAIGQLISLCIPPACTTYDSSKFFGKETELQGESWSISVSNILKTAWNNAVEDQETAGQPPLISLQDVSGFKPFEMPLTVADCTKSSVSVQVQPIDTGVLFHADKTYFLVGLAGEVGQSLCQWMVEHGARHLALTSRRPKVHPKFVQSMAELGAAVRILPLDITNAESLHQCYDEISKTMPPVAGVANGAMVLEDSLFESMSFETLKKVLDPKVIGTSLLDDLFYDAQLDFFIAFSSITGVVGNSGQSNYIAANMFMTALTAQRKKRGVAGSAIAISSLMGIGYVERSDELTGDYFKKVGYRNISEQDLHQLFAEAILAGRPGSSESEEIVSGLEPLYADTQVKAQFRDDIRFNHFIMERPGTQTYGGKLTGVPVRAQLAEAKSKTEACAIIKDSFLVRLKRTLMISQDDSVSEKASLVEQGVDSLMAVEVRSWFLKELEVDIPVLKVLSGSSISSLLTEAIAILPTSIVDLDALPDTEEPIARTLGSSPNSLSQIEVRVSSTETSSENESSPKSAIVETSLAVATPMTEINDLRLDASVDPKIEATSAIEDTVTPTKKEVCTPMSYGQARFWFLSDYLEDKRSFDMTVMFKITGKINVDRMRNAVQMVVQRHEALRTRYFWSGEGDERVAMQGVLCDSPVQMVHKFLPSEADAKTELRNMHNHVWDLGSWEAAKIHLLTVTDDTHYLLVGGHHISWDGYSFSVLFVDLESAYAGKPMPPLGPESQYPAFARWQIEQYETGGMKKEIDSWRAVIDPNTPPMPLFPFARTQTRPILDHFSQHEAKATISPNVISKLKLLARKHGATMFHVYLAALKGLTWQLLPEIEDHYIGVADANRISKEFIGSLGFFLNLLPVPFSRGHVRKRISDLIRDARDKAYATLERSIVPWNVILKELKIPRSNTCAPIFQLFVDYRQIVQDRSTWGECKISDEDWLNSRNGYDLTLGITDNPTGESLLSLRLQANLYDEASTHLLMRSYVNVLETFASGVDMYANELPCWAPVDVDAALMTGKGPRMQLEWPATLSHRIEQMVKEKTTDSALRDGLDNNLTYEQMDNRINAIAASLVASGAVPGSPIGVFQEPSSDWICSMLAVFKVGATYIPLDLRNSIVRLISIVKDVQPTILISDNNTKSKTKLLGSKVAVEIVVSDILSSASTPHFDTRAEPESVAIILFTSGTTGKPKGIRLTHDNLRAQCEGYSRFCDIPSKASVVLQQTIYSFDVSLDQIFAALADGGCLVIAPADKRGDPRAITELMVKEGVTYTVATPSEYEMWFRYAHENLIQCKEWRAAFGGGEHLHSGLIQEFANLALPELRLFNNYGPTEASLAITKGEVEYRNPSLEDHVPAGYIEPNYEVAIVDSHLKPVPVGVLGEIVAGGPGVAAGYFNLPEMTAEKFVSGEKIHPSASKGSWYRTGDRGRLRSDSALYVEGRILGDSQVKIRGFRVELGEIEVVLLETAKGALSHAVVTARGTGEERFLAAHVVFTPDYPQDDRQDLVKHLQTRLPLPPYMQPSIIIVLANIPVTSNFKFDRKAIQALPLPQAHRVETVYGSEIETKLAEMWRSMIPQSIGEITPETDFFDVGGNSILLVKLQSSIKRDLKSTPLLVELMERSTFGGMAKVIESSSGIQLVDWTAETTIPRSLTDLVKNRPGQSVTSDNFTVILAGATGYLGRSLLPRLLQTPQISVVYCLVQDEGSATKVLFPSSKLKLVRADLAQTNLGLSTAEFSKLAGVADLVINCAANRSFWDGYEVLRPVNVTAVKELTHLCLVNNASFHTLSSEAVQVYEDMTPPKDGSDGYIASKWAAETFLHNAANKLGLSVHVHRPLPALQDAHGPTPNLSPKTILGDLLQLVRSLGRRPDFKIVSGFVDVAPVSQVVEDMLSSITHTKTETGGVQVVTHNAQLRVHIRDFADCVEKDAELGVLPTMNPLHWFRDAKLAGFKYFILSQNLVMSSDDGELVSVR